MALAKQSVEMRLESYLMRQAQFAAGLVKNGA
jgi:hypothetical protein